MTDLLDIGAWDLTGSTATLFQDIAGNTPATTLIGRVTNLVDGGEDLYAPATTRKLSAQPGFALGDGSNRGGLITDNFAAIEAPLYFAIRFRLDVSGINGHHLLNGLFSAQQLLVVDQGITQVRAFTSSTDNLISAITTTSGDHIVEILVGGTDGDRYAVDGGAWINSQAAAVAGNLTRIAISHDLSDTLGSTNKRWRGRIYRIAAASSEPTTDQRSRVRQWLESGGDLPSSVTVPVTDEEIWSANFADAQGAPPQTTALLRASDAQKLADHNVGLFLNGPQWYRFDVEVPIGEFDQFKPLTVRTFRANLPGLTNGKKLLIMSREGRTGSTRITLTCWG